MHYQLKYPDYLTVTIEGKKKTAFGGNQSWYKRYWQKEAGCGPTCAATLLSYMSQSDPKHKNLYNSDTLHQHDFLKHMNQVYRYVTPGILGIHKTHRFINGVLDYASQHGTVLTVHSLITSPKTLQQRRLDVLEAFVLEAFKSDSPIAFLNLDVGEAKRLQPWHWITITSVDISGDTIMATASDEGNPHTFNLGLWYQTTPKHGGLIYFT